MAKNLPELTVVRTLRETFTDNNETVPTGATGTIVSVYANGLAYCVEFTEPVEGLADLPHTMVEPCETP